MIIEKKLIIRRVSNEFACMGCVQEVDDSRVPHLELGWVEATDWVTREHVRQAAPEQEIKNFCISKTNMYVLKNYPDYHLIQEETFL